MKRTRSSLEYALASLFVPIVLAAARPANAQEQPAPAPAEPAPAPAAIARVEVAPAEQEDLERLHREAIGTRRALADAVLIAGLASLAGGAVLMIPDADDLAWRFAGVNTAIFGGVNTAVGLLALYGIRKEEREWESDVARAARRTPDGLARARVHAATDERRESVGHAVNLGLNCAYLGVAGTAILASQLGVDHPGRWLASGIAVGVQAMFLVGVDYIGLARSRYYHGAFLQGLTPSLALTPSASGADMRFGLGGTF